MNGIAYEATVINGQLMLPGDIHLPDNSKVFVVVPNGAERRTARISSPRLLHPEQAADFVMDVQEIPDAGV